MTSLRVQASAVRVLAACLAVVLLGAVVGSEAATARESRRQRLRDAQAAVVAATLESKARNGACPCPDPKDCQPITKRYEKEIFGFYGGSSVSSWATELDWQRMTTLAWPPSNASAMCTAHRNGVRMILPAPANMPLSSDPTVRQAWIKTVLEQVKMTFADGMTFDYESPMDPNSPQVGSTTIYGIDVEGGPSSVHSLLVLVTHFCD